MKTVITPASKVVLPLAFCGLLLAACDDQGPQDSGPGTTLLGMAANDETELGEHPADCEDLPSASELQSMLRAAPEQGEAGGMFSGQREWAAVVNRSGQLCAVAASTQDPAAAWIGSLAIAKAKAYTANGFSTDLLPLSTARLYTLSQPGRPLYGAANAHPFNPQCFATPENPMPQQGQICGGTIVFGGGLALYKDQTRIGGLGLSGDTPCADHEIAKRVRTAAELNPPQGQAVDDIQYVEADGPTLFAHPLCQNTWRNGMQIGEAAPSQGYQPENPPQQ